MELKFKTWLENLVAKTDGIKNTVLDFLKDKLSIQDDEAILTMPLSSIDQNVIGELLNRGFIQNAPEELLMDIKNGSLTVGDMVDRLAGGEKPPLMLPFDKSVHNSV